MQIRYWNLPGTATIIAALARTARAAFAPLGEIAGLVRFLAGRVGGTRIKFIADDFIGYSAGVTTAGAACPALGLLGGLSEIRATGGGAGDGCFTWARLRSGQSPVFGLLGRLSEIRAARDGASL